MLQREAVCCEGGRNKGHLERAIQITSSIAPRMSEDINPGSLDMQKKNAGMIQGSVAKENIP